MANEARVYSSGAENAIVRRVNVANANIPKGSLLVYQGSISRRGVVHSGGVGEYPLGFTVEEVSTDDTSKTTVGVQRTGEVVAKADGTVSTGDLVEPGDTANQVRTLTFANLSSSSFRSVLGRALENATDGNDVRIALMLG